MLSKEKLNVCPKEVQFLGTEPPLNPGLYYISHFRCIVSQNEVDQVLFEEYFAYHGTSPQFLNIFPVKMRTAIVFICWLH